MPSDRFREDLLTDEGRIALLVGAFGGVIALSQPRAIVVLTALLLLVNLWLLYLVYRLVVAVEAIGSQS